MKKKERLGLVRSRRSDDNWDTPREPTPKSDVPELVLDDPTDDAEDPTMEDWTYNEGNFEETTYQCGRSWYTR